MKRLMLLSSALFLSATMAMADVSAQDLVAAYQANGYTKIEVTTGLTQIKVEAIMGNSKVEVIYDAVTGAILKQESGWAKRSERGTGIEVKSEDHDFLDEGDQGGDQNDDGVDGDDDHSDSGSDDGDNENENDGHDDHGGDDNGDHSGAED